MQKLITTILALTAFAAPATADDSWTLTTVDFNTQPVTVRSIGEEGVRVVPAGGGDEEERLIPLDQFVQLERGGGSAGGDAAPAAGDGTGGRFMLHMLGGDRIGGEPVEMQGEQLVWTNAAVGEVTIPLSRLLAMTLPDGTVDYGRRTEDVVLLGNGDAVRGIVTGMTPTTISVKAGEDETVDVPLEAVVDVRFAQAAGGPRADAPGFRVRLDDGSSLSGPGLAMGESGEVELTLGPDSVRKFDAARVLAVEQVNGPVSWLTSRAPSEDLYVPFLGTAEGSRTRVGQDAGGEPFLVGGRSFSRGVGVYAYSKLTYALDGNWAAFRTRYGMNDGLSGGDVDVRILLDGKVVHEEKGVRPGKLSPVVVVDLAGAKELSLEVDFGKGIHVQDRLNWIEPALLRDMPAAANAAEGGGATGRATPKAEEGKAKAGEAKAGEAKAGEAKGKGAADRSK